ncbi:MAG: FHA domain-containing protein [Phycisphaerae bacterium]|nr:FHA domain-containing protein [Phycisphaerae bacterium]
MDAKLVIFSEDGDRREFPLKRDVTVIGRKQDCGLRIPLSSVSREHCQVEKRGDSLFIRDLGSSNGTFYNGDRVQEVEMKAGDAVVVGPVHFTVVVDDKPSKIEVVKTILPAGADAVMQPGEEQAVEAAGADEAAVANEDAEVTVADVDDDVVVEVEEAEVDLVGDTDGGEAEVEPVSAASTGGMDMEVAVDDDPIAALEALAAMDSAADGPVEDALSSMIDEDDD